ncbi:hypothetical protein K4F52_006358 [Lecanicillium sp. MT-2017a]|nr:hypothetical protein K4F52_006358 [Lecanicillium sp. MT-2017a]
MLEFFAYKKIKKHKAEKKTKEEAVESAKQEAQASSDGPDVAKLGYNNGDLKRKAPASGTETPRDPVLHPDDERFIEDLLSNDGGDDDEPAPPLPPRVNVADLDWPSDTEAASSSSADAKAKSATATKDAEKSEKQPNRLSIFFKRHKKSDTDTGLKPDSDVGAHEAEREENDLSRVLDRLNLSAKNNKVVSVSNESSAVLKKFTQVFKDLVNGVPTAYDDLAKLVEDRDGTIAKGFDKLPSSLKKLVTQLPEKVTSSLGPEILAAAAASQGIKADSKDGMKGTAKKVFLPNNIMELVTKPGAIVAMLRAIVEALKTRWPAFLGMNVLWSVALSLLLFVLWYCHKRGRETRLDRERTESALDGEDRVEELPDDPMLKAPSTEVTPPEEERDPAVETGRK